MLKSGIYALCLIFVFIGISTTTQAAEKDLAAYWAFEEGEGNTTEDLSGNDNLGNISGQFDWVEGIIGQAIECQGATTVDCGMGESLRIGKNLTTEFWIQPTETITGKNARIDILYMHWGPMFAFCTGWGQDGALTYWYDGPNPKPTIHSKTTEWKKDEWYHIVGTYDGSISILYVNSEVEASISCEGDILERDQPLKIGKSYVGLVDEVKIYSRALSEDEVGKHYRLGLTGGEAVDASGKLSLTWGQIKGTP